MRGVLPISPYNMSITQICNLAMYYAKKPEIPPHPPARSAGDAFSPAILLENRDVALFELSPPDPPADPPADILSHHRSFWTMAT
jgi:hypothetical protein